MRSEMQNEMQSEMHVAGTDAGCPKCRQFVYEPGWYQMLRRLAEPEPEREEEGTRDLSLLCGSAKGKAGKAVAPPGESAHPVSSLGF